MSPIVAELQRRWRAMFAALCRGEDLPPTHRLRAEGMAEAAVLAGLGSAESLDEEMDRCYREACGSSLAEDFGERWRDFAPFPENPAMARRAPVYPSTAD